MAGADPYPSETMVMDLVCGMGVAVQPGTPKAKVQGKLYYFCSKDHEKKFRHRPSHYAKELARG